MADEGETPLPRSQMVCIFVMQISEAFNVTILFPFVAFMVRDFGFAEESVGTYSGLLAASFCAAQFMSSVLWGRASDRYGRKCALLAGMSGSFLAALLFGFASSFSMAVSARLLCGLLNGNIGIMKSFLTEITDQTNRARAFSLLPLAWGAGTVLAPLVGGLLCRPALKWPDAVWVGPLLHRFPYALPVLVGAACQLVAVVVVALLLKEPEGGGGVGNAEPPTPNPCSAVSNQAEPDEKGVVPVMPQLQPPLRAKQEEQAEQEQKNTKTKTPVWRQRPALLTTGCYGMMAFSSILFDEVGP